MQKQITIKGRAFISMGEILENSDISRQTVYNYIDKNRLKKTKRAWLVYVDKEERESVISKKENKDNIEKWQKKAENKNSVLLLERELETIKLVYGQTMQEKTQWIGENMKKETEIKSLTKANWLLRGVVIWLWFLCIAGRLLFVLSK